MMFDSLCDRSYSVHSGGATPSRYYVSTVGMRAILLSFWLLTISQTLVKELVDVNKINEAWQLVQMSATPVYWL